MKTLKLSPDSQNDILNIASEILRSGGVIVSPTDTVYGLLANAEDETAVNKIYLIKNREASKPLPVFVNSIAAAKKIAKIGAKTEKRLLAAWPGKTTFVLNLQPDIKIFASNSATIALRIPKHAFLSELLNNLGFPVIATSANLAGLGPFTKFEDVLDQFANSINRPDLIINAGNLPPSKASTIIDLTNDREKILRQ